jgi:hypothetical protein
MTNQFALKPDRPDSFNTDHLVRRTSRWRFWGLLLLVLAALVAGYAIGRMPLPGTGSPQPTVSTTILVSRPQPDLLGHVRPESDEELRTFRLTQAALVKSRSVVVAALGDARLKGSKALLAQPDPVRWLEQSLQTDYDLSPEILRLSLAGGGAEDLRNVLDAVATTYVDAAESEERLAATERRAKLNGAWKAAQTTLNARRRECRDLAQAGAGGVDAVAAQKEVDEAAAAVHQLRDLVDREPLRATPRRIRVLERAYER